MSDKEEAVRLNEEDIPQNEDEELDFSKMKKKKKSKKKVDFTDDTEPAAENADQPDENQPEEPPADDDFAGLKKKKKKKKKEDFAAALGEDDNNGEAEKAEPQSGEAEAWLSSDRDYTYDELLGRLFAILRQNNRELIGDKKKYTIVRPIVQRDGNKKTVFVNISDICKRLQRPPEHAIQFLFAELGTAGSVDSENRLIIKGRFQQKQIENVLRRYIVEYVTCKTCKSADTLLTKDNRLYYVRCETCGSARSVSVIKTGFKAQTKEDRRALRA